MAGVSTRSYERVVPEMADAVGISKSAVSRETIDAGKRVLEELGARRFEDVDLLILYLDGVQFGRYHVLAAVAEPVNGCETLGGIN